ncbi:DUF418 domain-containing protein [Flavobacterium agrisoli]|uniref:DUF418 domain-containing protein n=1 Tax=Flavobacterium agrisoli TaxID=2793066 RepID=A0A934UJH6_9FLAO|nr:DUF418 domain-containing protein [Flavobacterium agrisoli]MBK0369902.1 DUF418 domain-containing protein [Flavobacterium agrisoli]
MEKKHQPIEQSKRTVIVDILRGWAILGVAIGNYSAFQTIGVPHETKQSIISEILLSVNEYLVSAKSWTLLSILFGYGFAILINNIVAKGKNPILFFSWRMVLLFLFAFINSLFWYGDILKDYAVLGLLMLLFYRLPSKTLILICSILIISIPFLTAYVNGIEFNPVGITTNPAYLKLYHSGNWFDLFNFNLLASFYDEMIIPGYAIVVHTLMFACMLLGFLLQKIDFFNRLNEYKKLLKRTFWLSLIISIIIFSSFNLIIFYKRFDILIFFIPYFWLVLSTMVFIASGICLLYTNGKLKTIFSYFSYGGKMTLTNYMAQNILGVFIFSGIGLGIGDKMPYWFYFCLAVFVFILQLFISKWWLSKYNYGPIEWLWRSASYRKLLPLKKAKSTTFTEINTI